MLNKFYDLPPFHLSSLVWRSGGGGDYIFSGFGETNCGYLQNVTYLPCFPFLRVRTLSILPVFYLMTSHIKSSNIHYFCPSSDQQNPRDKLIASAKYPPGTIRRKRRTAPQSPRNSACPFSSMVHYTPVAQEKISVHCTTLC